jgi:hypothetical protein
MTKTMSASPTTREVVEMKGRNPEYASWEH